ncbi:hypothetical protein VTN02DRAFT_3721 [Thermoascus thermophilus]
MTPHPLLKWLRRKRRRHPSPALPWEPEAIGIADSTCQFNAQRRDNPMKLPLPPARRPLTASASSHRPHALDAQRQSPFFARLPPEVRDLVYSHLFGHRRIHIEFAFDRRREQWRWWHRVCEETRLFPDKHGARAEACPTTAFREALYWNLSEGRNKKKMTKLVKKKNKKKPGQGHRLEGSNWLRTCRIGYQEALPILYGTNTFALGPDLHQLFRLTRVLPPSHLALLTSLDVEVSWISERARTPDMDDVLRRTYAALFRLVHHDAAFPRLRRLRLVFALVPHFAPGRLLTPPLEDLWVRPWEELAAGRRAWERLEFGVPESWVEEFRPRADRQPPGGRRYALVAVKDFDFL